MIQATHTHTRNPSGVTLFGTTIVVGTVPNPASPPSRDRCMRTACDAVMAVDKAMNALMLSVADINPSDPRHGAAYAAVDLLRSEWQRWLDHVYGAVPTSPDGIVAKAGLLSTLVERDEMDRVVGGPVVQLAASLAADVVHSLGEPGSTA